MINKKISVVVPCYKESANVLQLYERLKNVLTEHVSDWEIIFVDNASPDNSEEVFRSLAHEDSRVSVIFFSRNFGHSQYGYTAGTDYASGDAVVWIDGDLQDPPELISEFIKKWREGYDVVYGIRTRRKGSFLLRSAYKLFYRLFKKISYLDIPLDAGDFSLMDRKVADIIKAMPERD
ncbi:MAG: glycosyltransferase family 2 protein, partial [Patescibacteria group bacterium]